MSDKPDEQGRKAMLFKLSREVAANYTKHAGSDNLCELEAEQCLADFLYRALTAEQAYHARGAGRAVNGWDERDYKLWGELMVLPSYGLVASDSDNPMLARKDVVRLLERAAERGLTMLTKDKLWNIFRKHCISTNNGNWLPLPPAEFEDVVADILALEECPSPELPRQTPNGQWLESDREPGADTRTTPPPSDTVTYERFEDPRTGEPLYRPVAERGTTPPESFDPFKFELAWFEKWRKETEGTRPLRYDAHRAFLQAVYDEGVRAATQRAPVEQGRRLTKQQREELVSAAHTLGDFTIDTDHRAQGLILLVESYMAAAPDHAREGALRELRASGWMVAVHNDYRQDGKLKTFWLFVKGGRAIKGEGDTDAEALTQVAALADGKEGGE